MCRLSKRRRIDTLVEARVETGVHTYGDVTSKQSQIECGAIHQAVGS